MAVPARAQYDLVACNPPYFTAGQKSPDPRRAAARHEGGCTLEDVAAAAARALRYGGRFALCHRPDQLARVFAVLAAAGLEPKRLAFAKNAPGGRPWLFLLEARRGGKPGLVVEEDRLPGDTVFGAAGPDAEPKEKKEAPAAK